MPKFGPSGNSDSFYEQGYSSSVQMPGWLKNLGLDAYEYNLSKGVRIRRDTAEEIGQEARKHGIFLSIHAPYYINLASPEKGKRENSIRYIIETLHAARWMGGERIVVHTGSATGMDRKEALDTAENTLRQVLEIAEDEGLSDIHICPEVLGKINQLGNLDEILHMCQLDGSLIPTVDFGHLHARTMGSLTSAEHFEQVMDKITRELGEERAKHIHVHFSRVEFTSGGEKKHMTMDDTGYGPEFRHFAEVICKRGLKPVIICESRGTMAEDALKMKNIYRSLEEKYR